ncbi:MAG: type I phosphomannose isomerase catalytic subunit [Acidobacteriaceae bacterium]
MSKPGTQTLPPFSLTPYFSPRIWGVDSLAPWYDVPGQSEPIGEAWLTGDQCVVENGPCKGLALSQAIQQNAVAILGDGHEGESQFPLLMKVLFPREKLSVQVHPDDAMAQKYGDPRGKTECWYALEAQPDATVALGLKPGATQEKVASAIADHTLEGLLDWLPVHKGDMFFVDAGTVHAIGPGSVLLETQQNCDLTYRMYDYGRPRELHLEKSFEAMKVHTQAGRVQPKHQDGAEVLIDAPYFRVERIVVKPGEENGALAAHPGKAQILFTAKGTGKMTGDGFEPVALSRGRVAIVPAASTAWQMDAAEEMEIFRAIPQ